MFIFKISAIKINSNSKWIKDFNVRIKTIELLEINIGENLHDIDLGNDFLDITSKAQATKTKIDK